MKPPDLIKWNLKQLRSHMLARRFAIPKLQRNFVWDPKRAAQLMDSIYHDMPIGSLFLWEMDRKSAHLIRQSTDVLPSFNGTHKNIWFVIDGQQRLSVLHQAFEAQVRKNDAGREIDFGRLCFAVNPDRQEDFPRRIVYRKPVERELIPIRDILAPDWRRRMPGRSKALLTRIRQCRERLLNYPIPVVIVRSATREEIGEVFIRVNSQGMRITSVDRAIALLGNLDVRAMADELRQKIKHEVFDLPGIDAVLMGFNLISERPSLDGDPPRLDVMARRWSKRIEGDERERNVFERQWDKYQKSFRAAVDYLHHRFPVHDETYLPSANMLATLAVFFFHHPGPPNGQQATEIRRWFWATGVAERYSGRGYHRNIVADAQFFEALAAGKRKRFIFRDLLDPVLGIQGKEYSSRSARTRAFFCLLASHRPRYLENGSQIELRRAVISHANRRHRHHVFPQKQMRQHFSSRVYNSLCNICFLVSRDNQKIGGMRLPKTYLSVYQHGRQRQFRQVMDSHLIPIGEDSGIWTRGIVKAFKQFRRLRLKMICSAFEQEAGLKLFRKN